MLRRNQRDFTAKKKMQGFKRVRVYQNILGFKGELIVDNPYKKTQELAFKFFWNSSDDFEELLLHLWEIKEDIPPQLQLVIFCICGNLWDQMNIANSQNLDFGMALQNAKESIVMDPRIDDFTRNAFPALIGGIIARRAKKNV